MEAPEEAMSSNSSSKATGDTGDAAASFIVVKGKRTKRQRVHPPAPITFPAAPDSCSASEAASGIVTDEEDDTAAKCLMLLAQGRRAFHAEHMPRESVTDEGGCAQGTSTEKFNSRRFTETATTSEGKIGYYVYECKTCNKCFPSFQALGGHRTSHTKPRLALAPAGTTAIRDKRDMRSDDVLQINMSSVARQTDDTKPKVHVCSICGAEFNSGQALGGHMRRHRPLVYNVEGGARKERSFLSLDLNLPAPAGDELQRPRSSPAQEFSLSSKPPLFLPDAHGELPFLR